MKVSSRLVALIFATVLTLSCRTAAGPAESAVQEAPSGDNDGKWFHLPATMKYYDLPASAHLSWTPWPGDYWASYRGGIGFRWQTNTIFEPRDEEGSVLPGPKNYRQFLYKFPTEQELLNMTEDQIALLSPAEKYDLLSNNYRLADNSSLSATTLRTTYSLVDSDTDTISDWEGICNGWSVAALFEPIPKQAVTMTNIRGQRIRFYPGDLQALMSQVYYDYQANVVVDRLGGACFTERVHRDDSGRANRLECRDVNPMSLHMTLANYIARDVGFVLDVDPGSEVWNQPIYGYTMTLGNKRRVEASDIHAAPGSVNIVDVRVNLQYMEELDPKTIAYTPNQIRGAIKHLSLHYLLEVDGHDNLVGGEWVNEVDKKGKPIDTPDFIWLPRVKVNDNLIPEESRLSYKILKDLFNQSAQ
jgi:hypothetical protein